MSTQPAPAPPEQGQAGKKKSLSDKVREANQQSAANAQLRGGGGK